MMHTLKAGWRVIEYSNVISKSESDADEKVEMLNEIEFETYYPKQSPKEFHGSYAMIGARGYPLFDQRLKAALSARVKPRDIILHSFGRAHQDLVTLFPQCSHIEPHIGYPDHCFGAYRVFESQCWRHYHMGRDEISHAGNNGLNKLYQAVVPNFYDLDDWPIGDGAGDYVLFMGRIDLGKGISTIVEIIKAQAENGWMDKFVFAGQGDFQGLVLDQLKDIDQKWVKKFVSYLGVISGADRISLIGNARCMLMPTSFVEPFGGSGAESMLCGTPLLAVGYGAFTETISQGVSGYCCNTLGDWLAAIPGSKRMDRRNVAHWARSQFSLEACAPKFDAFFRQVSDLWEKGWYTRESYRIPHSSSSPTSL